MGGPPPPNNLPYSIHLILCMSSEGREIRALYQLIKFQVKKSIGFKVSDIHCSFYRNEGGLWGVHNKRLSNIVHFRSKAYATEKPKLSLSSVV
jgi:hypothetical protein